MLNGNQDAVISTCPAETIGAYKAPRRKKKKAPGQAGEDEMAYVINIHEMQTGNSEVLFSICHLRKE
jgi:hypothetical protein